MAIRDAIYSSSDFVVDPEGDLVFVVDMEAHMVSMDLLGDMVDNLDVLL